jgi:hypothetical protein
MSDSRYLWIAGLIFLILITGPYLYGCFSVEGDFLFNGFLLNPIDGNSYLAKIQLGRDGLWKFSLPFTAEQSPGGYLYLFYIFLGHIGQLLNLGNLTIFHAARIGGSITLLFSLVFYFRKVIPNQKARKWALIIALFGSGMGWLGIVFGYFSSDFWVAEMYPFLSAYTNPHFPLGLGLMLLLITPRGIENPYVRFMGGLLLAIIQPFGAVLAIIITGMDFILNSFKNSDKWSWLIWKHDGFYSVLSTALGGGFFVIYQYHSILNDPLLRIWNAQNRTPSPEPFDLLLSLSPIILMSFIGVRKAWYKTETSTLLIWAVTGLCLSVIPWPLQRRFLTGLFVPLSGLAGLALFSGQQRNNRMIKTARFLVFLFSIPTNLIVLFSGVQAIHQASEAVVYPAELQRAFSWIEANTQRSDIVLGDKRIGNLIPAYTGRRVLYGHPFETVDSERMAKIVEDFFAKETDLTRKNEIINTWDVDYILVENEEDNRSKIDGISGLDSKIDFGAFTIYDVSDSGEND